MRVKCVDLHPNLPLVLVSLFTGNIIIYDYSNQSTFKTIENSLYPIRAAKFIPKMQLVVVSSDDLYISVYNMNTLEKVKHFQGHKDYIRQIVIHPQETVMLTSSDDCQINLWDIQKGFSLIKTFDEHQGYVMGLCLNPRDLNVFGSAALDKTIKVWSIAGTNTKANFTLKGHEAGVNCLDYFKGDKPYIVSGGDDLNVKIWDYQTKQCLHTLSTDNGHSENISSVKFHPDLPLLITSSEDGYIKLWHSTTYKLESTLNYNLERAWSVDICKENSNILAFGYDEGTVVIKVGSDMPIVSVNNGKMICAKNMDLMALNLKSIAFNKDYEDGQVISTNMKELENQANFYVLQIQHSSNGHNFAISNDSEFSINKSQNGKANYNSDGGKLVFGLSNEYAVISQNYTIKVFNKENNLSFEIKTAFKIDNLIGGPLIAAMNSEFVCFYDWEQGIVIRRIDLENCQNVIWNENNYAQLVISSLSSFFVISHDKIATKDYLKNEDKDLVQGCEDAFNVEYEISESVQSGIWIDQLFFYNNNSKKLNYCIQEQSFTFGYIDKLSFIIGYVNNQNRLYTLNKNYELTAYYIPVNFCQYLTRINEENQFEMENLLSKIDNQFNDKIAKVLDQLNLKQLALNITNDNNHKLDLSFQLEDIETAYELALYFDKENVYKQVGDFCLKNGDITKAIYSFEKSKDFSNLLMVYTSLGMIDELQKLALDAENETKYNISFQAYFQLQNKKKCVEILLKSNKYCEAAYFAKSYCPSTIPEVVEAWRAYLEKEKFEIVSRKIANPLDHIQTEVYRDLKNCQEIEAFLENKITDLPADQYENAFELFNSTDLFKISKENNFKKQFIYIRPLDEIVEYQIQKQD